jgi:hypothetical protein
MLASPPIVPHGQGRRVLILGLAGYAEGGAVG